MPQLTVAICTYRRLEPLRTTLQSLGYAIHQAPGVAGEVLVIDNAAKATLVDIPGALPEAENPQVRQMVMGFAGVLPSLRYEVEGETGTSFARNHAVNGARHSIVLFTDDDVTFDGAWLARMGAAVVEHPECDFWGGRVEPVAPPSVTFPPVWFDPKRCPMLADTIVQYRPGLQSRPWNPQKDSPFYTANLALRVEAVRKAGMFDVNVGHRGTLRMGMEDSLMVKAIAAQGSKGWYAADAVVHHPIPPERLTRQYAREFARRQGWLSVCMLKQESPDKRVPRWLYKAAMKECAHGLGDMLLGTLTGDAGRSFAGQMTWTFNYSKLRHARQSMPAHATQRKRGS